MSKLRKICRILLLVGGIFSLVCTMCLDFLLGLAAIIVPVVMNSMGMLPEGVGDFIVIGGVVLGILLIFEAIFALIAGVLGIKGFKEHAKNIYVGNIVFGVLTGLQWLLLAGAVLGLIALKKEAKAAAPEAAEEPEEE